MGSGDDGSAMLVVRIYVVLNRIESLEFVDHVRGTAFTSHEGIPDDPGISILVNWDTKL